DRPNGCRSACSPFFQDRIASRVDRAECDLRRFARLLQCHGRRRSDFEFLLPPVPIDVPDEIGGIRLNLVTLGRPQPKGKTRLLSVEKTGVLVDWTRQGFFNKICCQPDNSHPAPPSSWQALERLCGTC